MLKNVVVVVFYLKQM